MKSWRPNDILAIRGMQSYNYLFPLSSNPGRDPLRRRRHLGHDRLRRLRPTQRDRRCVRARGNLDARGLLLGRRGHAVEQV